MNKEEIVNKPFYLIAKYWLGKFQGFIKIGDNEEEIVKLFEDKYMTTEEHDFGVTEESYLLLKVRATELLNDKDEQSPYCEVCGHCGEIGCCGIRNFITNHIEGKTNCKNEDSVISDLISLCEYKDEVFEENKKYKEVIDKAIKYVSNKKAIINTDVIRIFDLFEIDEQGYIDKLLDILKEVE